MPMTAVSERLVVMRCDVGSRVGVGHLMRCLALAEGLDERDYEVVVVADLDSMPWARAQVRRRNLRHGPPPPTLAEEGATIAAMGPHAVVIDSYQLPGWVYDEVRSADAGLLAFIDGDPGDRNGDVFLDQNIGAELDVWSLPAGTQRLAGLDYALMRNEVCSARPDAPRRESSSVPSVLAFFGGTDSFGAAPVVVQALAASALPFAATVVCASAELAHACRRVSLARGQRLEVVAPVDDLPRRVVRADLVVSAAGTSSLELACLGAAAALVCVADNQAASYERTVREGLAVGLGGLEELRATPARAVPALRGLLTSPQQRFELRSRGLRRVDGRGRDRVIDALEGLRS